MNHPEEHSRRKIKKAFGGVLLAVTLVSSLISSGMLIDASAAGVQADITPGSAVKTNDAYSPNPINAIVNDTVTWTNNDTTLHTVTSGSGAVPDGEFDSGILIPNGIFNYTFTEAGNYPYYCILHPNMVGTVIILGSPGNYSTTLGVLQVPSHVNVTDQFDIILIDGDLNIDMGATDEDFVEFEEGDTTAAKMFSMWNSTFEIRVNGQVVTSVIDDGFNLTFEETAPNTGVFVSDEELDLSWLESDELGTIQEGYIIDFLYTDLAHGPDQTTVSRVVVGPREQTSIVLDPLASVIPGAPVTAKGRLYNIEDATGLSNKNVTLSGSGAPVPQIITTTEEGIKFEDPNLHLSECSTVLPSGISDGSDTVDIIDDSYPDCLSDEDDVDGLNNVLRLSPGGSITLPDGIKFVKMQLQNMSMDSVNVTVTYGDGNSKNFTSDSQCPNVADLNLISDAGIKTIEIVGIDVATAADSPFPQCLAPNDGTVGISRLETYDPDSNPSERYIFDFEDLVAGPLSSPLVLGGGSFFATFAAPAETRSGWEMQAIFEGDLAYLPSESVEQVFNTIEPTTLLAGGGGGLPQTTIVPDTDAGITTTSCIADSDKDGLCNSWESTGSTAGIPYKVDGAGSTLYYKLSTDPAELHLNEPDIWVEIDYMGDDPNTSTVDESHRPFDSAVNWVKASFADRNIHLHHIIDDSELIPHVNAMNAWIDTDDLSDNDFYNLKQDHFGTFTSAEQMNEGGEDRRLQENEKLKAKAQAYHYALFVHSIGDCLRDEDPGAPGTPSGHGELVGNDLIVALGCGYGPYDSDPQTHDVGTDKEQAGTFMHELGHNLGLEHGGPIEYVTLPAGYGFSGSAPYYGQTNIVGDNGPAGSDGTRSFTVSNLKVLTPTASQGTVDITTSVKFNVNPDIVTLGTVTWAGDGSGIVIDSVTPSVSQHSAGTSNWRQISLKIRFTTTGSTSATTGALGTYTVPFTVSNWATTISTSGGLSTPSYGPRLLIDVLSGDYTMNCKANYPSVMSYSQQFGTIYDDPRTANPDGAVWSPTYSNWTGGNLVEATLNEANGMTGNSNYIIFTNNNGTYATIERIPTGHVNWHQTQGGVVRSDINYFKFRGCGADEAGVTLPNSWEVQKGFNDWQNLQFDFKKGRGSIDGVSPISDLYSREGTFEVAVAPEFGPLAMLALAAALIGIIAATMKYRKSRVIP
jgi:predicted secreted protein with PEFG-CTERM motif